MAKKQRTNTACCVTALNAAADGAVTAINLLPAPLEDGTIPGRDGRYWKLSDSAAVVSASNADIQRNGEHPLDEGHKMFFSPDAPAFGWFGSYAVAENGRINGMNDLTDLGQNAINNKHYRYASVVFEFDLDTLEILVIKGAGLTNNQNLQVQALNTATPPWNRGNQQENEMDPILKQILTALNISESAADTAPARIRELMTKETALNAQGEMIPKQQLVDATTALNAAQTELKTIKETAFKAKVTAALNRATEAGKLTPAAREKWEPAITDDTALNHFNGVMEAMPVLTPDQSAPTGTPPGGSGTALNQSTLEMGKIFGNSKEDLEKYGK